MSSELDFHLRGYNAGRRQAFLFVLEALDEAGGVPPEWLSEHLRAEVERLAPSSAAAGSDRR